MATGSYIPLPKPPPRAKAERKRPPRESKKHAAGQRQWKKITARKIEEAGGMCMAAIYQVCQIKATDGHHKLPRSRGGKHTPDNCLPVCRNCHDWIAANREEAIRMGLLE